MLALENPKQEKKFFKRSKECQVGMDLAALGKRWTFLILRGIEAQHADRFNQLLRSIPGLTARVLIMRLSELEKRGLILPVVIQERPRVVRWVLTEKGRDTVPILEGYSSFLAKWYPRASLENHRTEPVKRPSVPELIVQHNERNGRRV